jgi:hypothetical protein
MKFFEFRKNRKRKIYCGLSDAHPSHGATVHNGSAGAFATEHSHDDDDEGQDNDDFAMDR